MKDIYQSTGIYGIRNVVNGKVYVGKTMMNFGDRWDCHRAQLRGGYHDNSHLQRAWNKYGEQAFEFFIIEECSDGNKIDELERKYIAEYRKSSNCYNITDGGDATPNLGKHLSEETKRLIGNKNRVHMTGRKFSDDVKRKMAQSQIRRWKNATEEERKAWGDKMSSCASGYSWSEESKRAFSERQKENPNGAKYSVDDVKEIRILHEAENKTYREISEMLNIPRNTIYLIATYRRWKYV